jgi:hypothetical protein
MKKPIVKSRPEEFEEFGYDTMIACGNKEQAIELCGFHIHAYEDKLQSEIQKCGAELIDAKYQHGALRDYLYERPTPVGDSEMLARKRKILVTLVLAIIALMGCLGANMATFLLAGAEFLSTLFFALCLTIFPAVAGHLAFETIFAKSRRLQTAVALVALLLVSVGLVKVGTGRRDMTDRAFATPVPKSYVENEEATTPTVDPDPPPQVSSESATKRRLSDGAFLLIVAMELATGFFIGRIVHWHTEEDYVTWREVQKLAEGIRALGNRIAELMLAGETAKKYCIAGILRAQHTRKKPHPPYHRALTMLLAIALAFSLPCWAQTIEHYEGILIDTSGSISHGRTTNELFHEYLIGTRKLLLTEPPNSRLWVSSISTNSFGGAHEILKGWTPASRGVFTDDLNRARRQLATSFEQKSSGLSPIASGTDIFGGLWRLKASFESEPQTNASRSVSKTIWIFSDMLNETKEFPMPELIETGAQNMLSHAKANGHIVPLKGYRVHVCGASTAGLTSQAWMAIRDFWALYFSTAGAELLSYSTECDVER